LRPAELEKAIAELVRELQEMAATPHIRELRGKATTYARVIANWATYSPTVPQRQAMLECVAELQEKVAASKRQEVSHVSKKPVAPVPLPIPPDGIAWNASVSSGSIHPRSGFPSHSSNPPQNRRTTIPPVSTPRTIETLTPDLLRSRRSR